MLETEPPTPMSLCIDVGGGSVRVALIDHHGEVVALGTDANRLGDEDGHLGLSGNVAEINLEALWARLINAMTSLRRAYPEVQPDVVVCTGVRHALILMHGETVLLATSNLDRRGTGYVPKFPDASATQRVRLSGRWPGTLSVSSKLAWIKEHDPSLVEHRPTLLSLSDWVVFRLSGVIGSVPSTSSESGLFNPTTADWSQELVAASGAPDLDLPPTMREDTVVGWLTPHAASALGIHSGIPVVNAGSDTHSALIGMSIDRPGQIAVVAGTTTPCIQILDRQPNDPGGVLWSSKTAKGDLWAIESNAGMSGMIIEWLRGTFWSELDVPLVFNEMEDQARRVSVGSSGVVALLGQRVMQEHHDTSGPYKQGPGVFFEDAGSQIRSGSSRAAITRAVYEGCAFAIAANIERLTKVTGDQANVVRIAGGQTGATLWIEILATVLNRPIEVVKNSQVTLRGAAQLAFAALRYEIPADPLPTFTVLPNNLELAATRDAYVKWCTHMPALSGHTA